jgi:hypothetical protein
MVMKITNIAPGPRGFNSVNGPILLDPGAEAEADIFEREQQHLEATQWFKVKGDYTPNPDGPTAVLAQAAPAANDEIEALKKQLAERDAEIEKLKAGGSTERDDLKKQADELGIQYAGNISNVKLKELIDAKLAS